MKSTYFAAALGSLFFSLLPTAMAGHCYPHPTPSPSSTVSSYPPSSTPSPPPELDNTGNFTILASNISYPDIDGKVCGFWSMHFLLSSAYYIPVTLYYTCISYRHDVSYIYIKAYSSSDCLSLPPLLKTKELYHTYLLFSLIVCLD